MIQERDLRVGDGRDLPDLINRYGVAIVALPEPIEGRERFNAGVINISLYTKIQQLIGNLISVHFGAHIFTRDQFINVRSGLTEKTGYHQDYRSDAPAAFLTAWTPLNEEGPWLHVFAKKFTSAVVGSDEEILRHYRDHLIRYQPKMGEVVLMDGRTVHGTGDCVGNPHGIRVSLDFRIRLTCSP